MDQNEFMRQQMEATERMKRMHERSRIKNGSHTVPPTPDFVRLHDERNTIPDTKNPPPEIKGGFPAPQGAPRKNFDLASFIKDGDTALIIGLLLLLYSERADQKLLLALLYILI